MRGRRPAFTSLPLLLAVAALAAEPDPAPAPGILWASSEGEVRWTSDLDPGAWPEEKPTELIARHWQPMVPDIEVELIGGDRVRLRDSGHKVLVLDFWASWCAPCAIELPLLQRLQDAEQDNGLQILALNVDDDAGTIQAYTRGLGIRLPVGRGADLQEPLGVEALPTVILCDGEGRILGRWEGYTESVAEEIADRARRAYDLPPGKKLADALLGGELLGIDWRREFRAAAEGVAVIPDSAGDGAVVNVAGRSIRIVGADGWLHDRIDEVSAAGRLVSGDLDGDGKADWLSFRRGSSRFVRFSTAAETLEAGESPSPVLDAAVLAGAAPGEPGQIWLATVEGLFRGGPDGEAFEAVATKGRVESIAVASIAADAHVVALQPGAGLVRLDRAGEPKGESELPEWSKTVGAGTSSAGVAVSASAVRTMAVGRFTTRGRTEVALGTESGNLFVLDAADGSPVYRARWPGIRSIASGDIDGDGLDELAIGSGRNLVLLSARRAADSAPN